jgi:hypothetical protein
MINAHLVLVSFSLYTFDGVRQAYLLMTLGIYPLRKNTGSEGCLKLDR